MTNRLQRERDRIDREILLCKETCDQDSIRLAQLHRLRAKIVDKQYQQAKKEKRR